MTPADLIRLKRDGGELPPGAVRTFAGAAATGAWPDYQLSAMLMAVTIRGMTDAETATLTAAMADSGARIDLGDIPGVKVDKHSTGGVGDSTSLIVAPVAVACGVVVPMISGRGLGHTGGTLDKLEAIPGFRTNLTLAEFRATLADVGVSMIGQTAELAPADRVLYGLRDVTATVESVPLITASILSKKLAEGISGLVLDVKCGRGAFMQTRPAARQLAESLVRVGRANGLAVTALITAMDDPLGSCVGNALEVAECVAILKNEARPESAALRELSLELAARMVRLARPGSTPAEARAEAESALTSGAAFERFRRVVAAQGGDARALDSPNERLPQAPVRVPVVADRSGHLAGLDAGAVGRIAMRLGAGRATAGAAIDPAVGVVLSARAGDAVRAGGELSVVHARTRSDAERAVAELLALAAIGDDPPPEVPLVLEVIE